MIKQETIVIVVSVQQPRERELVMVVHAHDALGFFLALPSVGRSMPARIAMIAITTSNSMSVKADRDRRSLCAE